MVLAAITKPTAASAPTRTNATIRSRSRAPIVAPMRAGAPDGTEDLGCAEGSASGDAAGAGEAMGIGAPPSGAVPPGSAAGADRGGAGMAAATPGSTVATSGPTRTV